MLLILLLKAFVIIIGDKYKIECISFVKWSSFLVFGIGLCSRIKVKMLSCIKRPTLVPLIGLRQLFLRMHIKVALSNSKLLEVTLCIDLGNGLVGTSNSPSILLILHLSLDLGCNLVHVWFSNLRNVVLRLRQILELCQIVLLVDDSITHHHSATRGASATCLLLAT